MSRPRAAEPVSAPRLKKGAFQPLRIQRGSREIPRTLTEIVDDRSHCAGIGNLQLAVVLPKSKRGKGKKG